MLDGQTALDAVAEDRRRRELIRRLIVAIEAGAAARYAGDLVRIRALTSRKKPDATHERRIAAGAGM
jgi:hypothetical protein